ncbi:MAG: hypothetical protein K6T74_06755 [Geminicoccaceae bacterium]|nr:hypothetical protein [Geminicoccaceae bacterium]
MAERTYLDWNATAPLRPEARAAIAEVARAARAAPWPDPALAWTDVQDLGAELRPEGSARG